METTAYNQLVQFLTEHNLPYRELTHEPEGRTDVISEIRGNQLHQAAKAMVIMVKHGKKDRSYYLAVIPGDMRVDFNAIKQHARGDEARFAPEDRAETYTGCPMGSVPPISFHPELKLIVDPAMLEHDEIVFNAGRLDVSFFVPAQPFFEAAQAEILPIAQ